MLQSWLPSNGTRQRRSWLACRRFFAISADYSAPPFPNQRETLFFPSSQRFGRSLAILPSTTKQPSDQGINQRLAFLTLNANITKNLVLPAMASSGTMRGTPKGRGTVPAFTNSPAASNIPRPALESHPSGSASEAGGSTMSASRQKQSKRDEVCLTQLLSLAVCTTDNIFTGYSEEDRNGSQQEEAYHWPSTTNTKSTPRDCPRSSPQSSPPDQTKYYCC